METNLPKMLIPVSLFLPVKKVGYQNIWVHIFKIHTKKYLLHNILHLV